MKFHLGNKIFLSIFLPAILASLVFLYFSNFGEMYNDKTTHPAITDEIVDFYNLFYDQKITDQEKEWIIKGSIDEDIYPRWMNHYFDPIYNEGWNGEGTGFIPSLLVEGGARVLFVDKKSASSLEWMRNQELQSQYASYGGNRTWDRAIYEMAVNDNKKEAYYTLGFILHLMEDASVPDHTRNDSHAPIAGVDEGSPYEAYTDQFTRSTWNNIAQDLKNSGFKPTEKNTVEGYLFDLALYSNKNFFSKDTVLDKEYGEPKITKENGNYGYGIDSLNNIFKLVFINRDFVLDNNEKFIEVKEYSLNYKPIYYPILHDYFTLLSRQAIINGAGVINLFHKEVEKAKQDPEIIKTPPEMELSQRAVSFVGETAKYGWTKGVAVVLGKMALKNLVFRPTDLFIPPLADFSASVINTLKNFEDNKDVLKKLGTGSMAIDNELIVPVVKVVEDAVDEVGKATEKTISKTVETTKEAFSQIKNKPEDDHKLILAEDIKNQNQIQKEKRKVILVIDGDTFILDDDSRVRLIGINAPETDECFYKESADMLNDLILNKEVALKKDVSETDVYGRLLRYVYVNDIFVNDYMVNEGYAKEWKFPPDIQYSNQFSDSQIYAKKNNLGIWEDCVKIAGKTIPPVPETVSRENKNSSSKNSIDYMISSIGNDNPPVVSKNPESEDDDNDGDDGDNNNDNDGDDMIPPIIPFGINIKDGDLFTSLNDVNSNTEGVQINISGQGEENSIVIISVNPVYESKVASGGTWQQEIALSEGENQIKIKAQDEAGNASEEIVIKIALDSVGPISQINITNYNLMSLTFNVGWLAQEEDIATSTFEPQYKIGQSGVWQALTINSGEGFSASQDKTTYYFRVRAQDLNGNQGDWSEIAEAEINTKPIVFNEIAWMGTKASQYGEWIELFNQSNAEIDLSGWRISKDGDGSKLVFTLTKSIDPMSYLVIERTTESSPDPLPDINDEAGPFGGGSLSNSGEFLFLKDANSNIIDEITYWSNWYAGDNNSKRTMERARNDVNSNIAVNWLDYEGEGSGALDAGGNSILGTPKSQNSVHNKYYAVGGIIDEDTTFYKSRSPYFVYDNLTIADGARLLIESGVELLIDDNVQINIDGTIISNGIETDKVIFTSANKNPKAGDWTKIYFSPTSVNSELNHTNILYGGKWIHSLGSESAMIEIATSTVIFSNVLISESELRGIWLKNSNSEIREVVFDNINKQNGSTMLDIDGGNPIIADSTFRNTDSIKSDFGINASGGAKPTIENNSFSDTNYPIQIFNVDPVFSGNSASGNLYDNIYIANTYNIESDVVFEKDLPYRVNSMINVKNGAVLTINPGVEIMISGSSYGFEIQDGKLIAVGTPDDNILFTSVSGNWKWIYFTKNANKGSELKYVTFENGGYGESLDGAMLKIEGVDIDIENVNIKNSKTRGVWLIDSNSQIADSLFECNASNFGACGGGSFINVGALEIKSSDSIISRPIISNSTFKLNRIGIKVDEYSSPVFENIIFGEWSEANFMNTDPVALMD